MTILNCKVLCSTIGRDTYNSNSKPPLPESVLWNYPATHDDGVSRAKTKQSAVSKVEFQWPILDYLSSTDILINLLCQQSSTFYVPTLLEDRFNHLP